MKDYGQYCPIAHSLGVLGERWSLLVVRELMHGPRRYTDLAGGLPGIGTNILAARLRDLEAGGVLRKVKLPPPAASTVYELTPKGEGLQPVLHELARWGARSLGPPNPGDLGPGWLKDTLEIALVPVRPEGTIAFRVGNEEASLVGGGAVPGLVEDADVLVETDSEGFYHLLVDRKLEGVRIEGDVELLLASLGVIAPVAV